VASYRRMFVTEKVFFGNWTTADRERPSRSVVQSVKVPFYPRDVERGEGSNFELVGLAYVQGVMRDEGLEEGDPLGLSSGRARPVTIA